MSCRLTAKLDTIPGEVIWEAVVELADAEPIWGSSTGYVALHHRKCRFNDRWCTCTPILVQVDSELPRA